MRAGGDGGDSAPGGSGSGAGRGPALAAALTFARAVSERHERAPGSTYRLVVISGGAFAIHDLVDAASTYAVLGRSERAHVVLAGDDAVALRHALVRPERSASGWALRIVDLGSGAGLSVGTGAVVRDVLASGDVAVAIGAHALVALRRDGAHARRVAPDPPRLLAAGAVPLGAQLDPPSDVAARVTLSYRDAHATFALSPDIVDRGLMVGRIETATAGAMAPLGSPTLSRAHALVLRDGGALMLFDLASSTGTFVGKARIGAVVLSSASPVRLGLEDPVWLHLEDEAFAPVPETERGHR